MLKKYLLILIIAVTLLLMISGCGTTLGQDFDNAPSDEGGTISNVPNIARVSVTEQDQQIIITGYDSTVEGSAQVNIYSETNILLNSGPADSRGAFQIKVAQNPSLNAVEITSVAQNKLESPKARIEL